jgi:putative beta-lysine N-acetyltransferase
VSDKILSIGNSVVQHGKENDRVYLMKFYPDDFPEIIANIEKLCRKHKYSKVFAKVPSRFVPSFLVSGYSVEAYVPRFFYGNEDAFFLARYFSKKRSQPDNEDITKFQAVLKREEEAVSSPLLESRFEFGVMTKEDAEVMASLYREVFASYPFPIHDAEYLKETMDDNIVYYGITDGKRLVGLSSAETDKEFLNVEMTDFAVLPEFRGNGVAYYLLCRMEEDMKARGMKTAFTIARLKSAGMNLTFKKAGYSYSGTLINNTNIAGALESMNVWYKPISVAELS